MDKKKKLTQILKLREGMSSRAYKQWGRRHLPRGYVMRPVAATAAQKASRMKALRSYKRNMTRKRALAIANSRTAGFLGLEKKFYDTNLASGAIPAPTDCTGGEFDPSATSMISTPAQGDNEQQRDGKKIVIKGVQIKGVINRVKTLAGPIEANHVFVALVLDTQTNGAQMNSEDCFKNTNATALTAVTPVRNLLFSNRFKVLKTWEFDMQYRAWDADIAGAETRVFEYFQDMNLPVNFNAGTTASVANVIDNSLHIIAFSTVTGNTISYNARIRFMG